MIKKIRHMLPKKQHYTKKRVAQITSSADQIKIG